MSNLTEYSTLTFHPEFYNRMTAAERRPIDGREGAVARFFDVQGWPEKVRKVEIVFVAPTVRHKPQLRTYDLAQFKRWIDGGLVIINS